MKYIALFISLLVLLFACKTEKKEKISQVQTDPFPKMQKYQFTNRDDTLLIEYRKIDEYRTLYVVNNDTIIEDIRDTSNLIGYNLGYANDGGDDFKPKSKKIKDLIDDFHAKHGQRKSIICTEQEIQELYKKTGRKLTSIELPDFFKKILKPGEKDTFQLNILTGNLDEDSEPEKVLCLEVPPSICNLTHFYILDKQKDKWNELLGSAQTCIRLGKVKARIEQGFLICENGGWGSGFGAISHEFYCLRNQKLQNVLRLTVDEFWSQPKGLSHYLDCQYQIIDNRTIKMIYKYNLNLNIYENNKHTQEPVLKDKFVYITCHMDSISNKFQLKTISNPNIKFEPNDGLTGPQFQEAFKDELYYLMKNGTVNQRKYLSWLEK